MTEAPAVRLAEIAATPGRLAERAEALLHELGRHIPFDAAWMALAEPLGNGYSSLASKSLDQSTVQYLSGPEMAANPQLTRWAVHDLNADPTLPEPDASFDLALCTVSVQYLTQPLETFAEVRRVLRPGAPFLVTFSNRCFPTKAIAIWHHLDDRGHMRLVERYLEEAGDFQNIHGLDRSPRRMFSDPLYAVIGESTGPHVSRVGA